MITPVEIENELCHWQGLEGGRAFLINLSENHTFRIDTSDGQSHILRVHRPGYNSRAAIKSELSWLQALATDTDLPVVTPMPGRDGCLLQEMDIGGASLHAVRFAFEQGREATEEDGLERLFETLGEMAAICHKHVETWQRPKGFTRPDWTTKTILPANGLWGNWRSAPGVTEEIAAVLDRAEAALYERFSAYGNGADRFGLIHADMRSANLLLHEGALRLIDFDDSGFGWFAYDFAAAVSFFEHTKRVAELKGHWLEGYRQKRAFGPADEAMLNAAVMLRRFALLAWTNSHAETDLAKIQHPHFAVNSADLAERWLSA